MIREGRKRRDEIVEARIRVEVLAIDVRDDGNRGIQPEERSVAFVGLRHERRATADARVAPERGQASADHGGWIESCAFEHQGHHRRRRRLSVRSRDRDPESRTHQRREHVGPRDDRQSAPARLDDLGVRRTDGRRNHDRVHISHVRRRVARVKLESKRGQSRRDVARCRIAAADPQSLVQQHFRDRAHTAAANADAMDRARVSEHRARLTGLRLR